MKQRIKVAGWGLVVCVIIILLIMLPILIGGDTKKIGMSSGDYYTLIAGIIGGMITLYALSLQFYHERQRIHEEKLASARCFFKINYLSSCEREVIQPYVCKTDSMENDSQAKKYLILELKSQTFVYDCNIVLETEDKTIQVALGVVVPDELIAVPVVVERKLFVTICYRTQMKERLRHSLHFDDIRTRIGQETIECGDGILLNDEEKTASDSGEIKTIRRPGRMKKGKQVETLLSIEKTQILAFDMKGVRHV